MTFQTSEPHRILVVRTDRLGDMVLTLPMLAALRRCFPRAHLALLLRRYTAGIVEGNPYVDALIWYDGNGGGVVPFREMARTLRAGRFDAAVVVYPTGRLAWLMFLSGIPVRVGTGYRVYSFLFNRRVFEHRKDARRHELEYNLGLLKVLGCTPAGEPELEVAVAPDAAAAAESLLRSAGVDPLRPYAVLHPGSGGSARDWSARNFRELALRLRGRDGIQIVVTGSRAERGLAASVTGGDGTGGVSVAGLLEVRELAALLKRASLFVSNSTGPLHLAVAVGTPVVGLYPPHPAMSKARWGPYRGRNRVLVPDRPADCTDCVRHPEAGCPCMDSITVDAVHAAARELLTGRPATSEVDTRHA